MKRLAAALTALLMLGGVRSTWLPASKVGAQASPATEMATYYVVMLRRGPAWTPTSTPESAAVSRAHMDNIDRLTKAGTMVVAGPFVDQAGANAPAGLFVLRAGSLDEAKTLAQNDPAVKAGRFVSEVLPWMAPRTLRY